MSCVIDLQKVSQVNVMDDLPQSLQQSKVAAVSSDKQLPESMRGIQGEIRSAHLNHLTDPDHQNNIHEIRLEIEPLNQHEAVPSPQNKQPTEVQQAPNLDKNKEKCISLETEPNIALEMASLPFKNITKGTQQEFMKVIDYGKSSNVKSKYMVFREINVNTQSIQETSQKIKKASKLTNVVFSNFNDFQFTQKSALLQSVVESIDMTQVAQPEEFKKAFALTDYYTALEMFALKFQSLYRWNIFLLIFQHLIIQAAFIIGLVKYYSDSTDQMIEFTIFLSITLSLITEFFLIKRSKYFLEKEGNDYFFIIAALVQAFAGIIAVSFEVTNAPTSTTTAAYLLFLFSYLAYILFVTIRILPQFEFLKDTFYNFLYTDPKSQNS